MHPSDAAGRYRSRILIRHGAKVVLGARREDRLAQLAEELGEHAVFQRADVSNEADMNALADLALSSFGKIDALFANAGIMPGGNLSEQKIDDWKRMVDCNINGVLHVIAAVLPQFLRQKSGHIIVTSSAAGLRSVPGNAVYCGTKHFVRALLDSFRMEAVNEGSGIKTTTIYPGAVQTELLNSIAPSETKTMVEAFYREAALESQRHRRRRALCPFTAPAGRHIGSGHPLHQGSLNTTWPNTHVQSGIPHDSQP